MCTVFVNEKNSNTNTATGCYIPITACNKDEYRPILLLLFEAYKAPQSFHHYYWSISKLPPDILPPQQNLLYVGT